MRGNGRIKERQATTHKMMAMLNGPASLYCAHMRPPWLRRCIDGLFRKFLVQMSACVCAKKLTEHDGGVR